MCYGRDPLVNDLMKGVLAGESFAVYGGRRIGKTTVLRRLLTRLSLDRDPPVEKGLRLLVGNVDVHGLEVAAPASIWNAWIAALTRSAEEACGVSPPVDSQQLTYSLFVDWLRTLCASFHDQYVILLLTIDDYDHLFPQPWEDGLRSNLTALVSNTPGISERLALILTGDHYLHKVRAGPSSSLGTLLRWRKLTGLNPLAAEGLMQEPSGISWPSEVMERVWNETVGHPCLIQEWMRQAMLSLEWPNASAFTDVRISVVQEVTKIFERWWERFDGTTRDLYGHLRASSLPWGTHEGTDIFGYRPTIDALDVLLATGVAYSMDGDDRDAIRISHAGRLFADWYDVRGSRRTEDERLVDGVSRLIDKLEIAMRDWILRVLNETSGDGFGYLLKNYRPLVTVWRETAIKSLDRDVEFSAELIRFSALGDLFDIIMAESISLGEAFGFGPRSGDRSAKIRNRVLFEERKKRIVRMRHAIKHNRREDITLDDSIMVRVSCQEVLAILGGQRT
jgi:hypothetical protein